MRAFVLLVAWLAGCSDYPSECPQPIDPCVRYMNESWAQRDECDRIDFGCDEGQEGFDDPDCGCGCRCARK